MYNLIIGYNSSSINLIKNIIDKKMIIFLIDNKISTEIKINSDFLYYYEVNIYDMKEVLNRASKSMLLNVFVVTEDDYLNLMIEEALSTLDNVKVIYNSKVLFKLSSNGDKNMYMQDFFQGLCKEEK